MAQEKKTKEPNAPPPRRNRTEAVARGAAPVARDIFAGAGFADPTLVLRWAEIAGREVARLCQPMKLNESASGGVLTLKTEPAAALFLQHESRVLCERINSYFGRQAVSRLRFVQGPIAQTDKPRHKRPEPGPVPPHDPVLAFQGPESLRERLLNLARQRRRGAVPD